MGFRVFAADLFEHAMLLNLENIKRAVGGAGATTRFLPEPGALIRVTPRSLTRHGRDHVTRAAA